MIELNVADFCQNCLEFEPYVYKWKTSSNHHIQNNTRIMCEHMRRCIEILKYVREGEKNGETDT